MTRNAVPAKVRAVDLLLRLATATGLAVDAVVHAQLASDHDAIRAMVSEGQLFRIEAGAAAAVALGVLALPGRRCSAAAAAVSGSALAAVLLSVYVDAEVWYVHTKR